MVQNVSAQNRVVMLIRVYNVITQKLTTHITCMHANAHALIYVYW